MKNIIKLIGIIALVAVIGFSFTACGDDDDDNGGGGGTFTLINIPSVYNGWYMWVACVDSNGNDRAYGTMYDSGVPGEFALISNGRASIKMWDFDGDGFQRYTRTETVYCSCYITNGKSGLSSDTSVFFENVSISFTNGNATKSYADFNWLDG